MADPHGTWRLDQAERDSPSLGAGFSLLHRRFDRRAEIVRSQVEQDQAGVELGQVEQVLGQPVEPQQLLATRLQEFGACVGVVSGRFVEQFVEGAQGRDRRPQLVRDIGQEVAAAVPIVPNDPDALLQALGHRIELARQLGDLGCAGQCQPGRHAATQLAPLQVRRCRGQPSQWRREPSREDGRHDDGDDERDRSDRQEQAGHVGHRRRAQGVRVGQRDLDGPRRQCEVVGKDDRLGGDPFTCLALSWRGSQAGAERAIGGRDEPDVPGGVVRRCPDPDGHVREGQRVGDLLQDA